MKSALFVTDVTHSVLYVYIFSLTPEEAMVDNLAKACGTKNIIVLYSENTDLVSNIYRPICKFLTGSLRITLMTDTVDVELTVWMVKGIYVYRKDHTMESTIVTSWSKNVTPFPSLRHKIEAYKDKQRDKKVLQWTNSFQFPTDPITQTT